MASIQVRQLKSLLCNNDDKFNGYKLICIQYQFSHSVMSNSLWLHELQHTRPPCPSPIPGVHPDVHRVITSIESVMPSSHLILCSPLFLLPQIPPASESFPMSQLFSSGGQSTGVSDLALVLPKKYQGWSPSEWTGWISLQSKGL